MDSLESIADLIREYDDFVVIAHVSPDGDTLGCALALSHTLRRMGKRAQAVCEQRVPHIYEFLPGAGGILAPAEAMAARAAIAVDCADEARLGQAAPLFRAAERTCCIDHHVTNTRYAQLNYIDGDASSSGELIYALIRLLGVAPDRDVATCLYTAIMSDTGNFAYSNTTPETFRVAAELMTLGADNTEINRRVYRTIPLQKQRLLGRALTKLEIYEGGRIGLSRLAMEDISACGASEEDTEGIIDHIRDIEGVEIAIMIRESSPGEHKVSLRSKHYADVGGFAKELGGGGHAHAAGYTARGSMEEVAARALSRARDAVRA